MGTMFDDVDPSIKTALYALTVLHVPLNSSVDWSKKFLVAFLNELKLPESTYEAFCPLTSKAFAKDEVSSTTSIDSSSVIFMEMIDTAGYDRIDLFIGISVYLRFRC